VWHIDAKNSTFAFHNPNPEQRHHPPAQAGCTGTDGIMHVNPRLPEKGEWKTYRLRRDYSVEMTVTIPANGYTWFVIK